MSEEENTPTEPRQPISDFLHRVSQKARKPEANAIESMKSAGSSIATGFGKLTSKVSDRIEDLKGASTAEQNTEDTGEDTNVRVNDIFGGPPPKATDKSVHDILTGNSPRKAKVHGSIFSKISELSREVTGKPKSDLENDLDAAYDDAIGMLAESKGALMDSLSRAEEEIAEAEERANRSSAEAIAASTSGTEYSPEAAAEARAEDAAPAKSTLNIVDIMRNAVSEQVEEIDNKNAVEDNPVEEVEQESVTTTVDTEVQQPENIFAQVFGDGYAVTVLGKDANNGKAYTAAELNAFAKGVDARLVKVALGSTKNKDGVTKTQLAQEYVSKFATKPGAKSSIIIINAKDSAAGLPKLLEQISAVESEARSVLSGVVILTGARPLTAAANKFVTV